MPLAGYFHRFPAPDFPPILPRIPKGKVLPIMAPPTIIEALNPPDRDHCYAIRTDVFCGEQQVSREIEFDGLDSRCRHYLAMLGDFPVGTARVRPIGDGLVKFERIAVLKSHRGRNIGRALMDRAMADAAAAGATSGRLHAQTYATALYEKLGFTGAGELFMEAGIEHISMIRQL
jgi:predicted GNAT family N-acyltransferase